LVSTRDVQCHACDIVVGTSDRIMANVMWIQFGQSVEHVIINYITVASYTLYHHDHYVWTRQWSVVTTQFCMWNGHSSHSNISHCCYINVKLLAVLNALTTMLSEMRQVRSHLFPYQPTL